MQKNTTLSDQISATLHSFQDGQHRYLNEFIQQYKIAADLLALGIYPDAKEITESFAAFSAVRKYLKQYDPQDPNVTLVSVGDGKQPRTAALFAFKTKWRCVSIDPSLDLTKIGMWENKIQRLTCVPHKVEDINMGTYPMSFKKVVIVAVHSHASMARTLDRIEGTELRSLISVPCCIEWGKGFPKPSKEYLDSGIWSPRNRVKIWKSI
jgi:hypothetical protein